MNEILKDIPDYEGIYQASSIGRIKTLIGRYRGVEYLKEGCSHNGYLMVTLVKEKKRTTRRVHQVIAQLFVPNPNNYPCVNHKDCDKTNNRPENLEWCTIPMNNLHAKENGKILKGFGIHPRRKYPDEFISEIKNKYIPYVYGISDIMRDYGLTKGAVIHLTSKRNYPELIPLHNV